MPRPALMLALVLVTSAPAQTTPRDPRLHPGKLLFADDFTHGLGTYRVELELGGKVAAIAGTLDIDVPAGATVWLAQPLESPVMIQYQATVISAGGPNDRVSDLNAFWMATDPLAPGDLFANPRSGAFAGYNGLRLYYVGLGGNGNTNTRFRRYIGDKVDRPLLPENDLSVAMHPTLGITPNRPQNITLIARGSLIQYWRDGTKIFEMTDPAPYTRGWFGLRTTQSHLQIRNLRITRLLP